MISKFNTPILFLIFNRPVTTRKVFDEIRKVKPTRLYIAADGPRESVVGERQKCDEARAVTEKIDWPCKVMRLYRNKNLGCKKAVSGAIGWFFKNVEEGIILEDDCLPDQSFFRYCEELLIRYRHDDGVGIINGNNFSQKKHLNYSYYFSFYLQMWGWATWRRTWNNYDLEMKKWPQLNKENWLGGLFSKWTQSVYWWSIFDSTYRGKVDTWDYQWVFSSWVRNYLNITPRVNLVKNIGFGRDAAHLRKTRKKYIAKRYKMAFPMAHPLEIERNVSADKFEEESLYNDIGLISYIKWIAIRIFNFL